MEKEKDSSISKENDTSELEERDTSELEEKSEMESSESEIKNKKYFLDFKNKKDKTASELKEKIFSGASKLEEKNENDVSKIKRNVKFIPELEKRDSIISAELEEEECSENEDIELKNKIAEGTLELEEQSHRILAEEDDFSDEDTSKVEETAAPLLIGESVSINMHGESPTVHVHTEDNKAVKTKKKESPYLSPIRQIRKAWDKSTNVYDFFLRTTLIIFSTLGWILCIGGVPFVSIAMFIIGSVYIDDCKVQPNIPIYLIVGGVCGTIQHFIAFWNKCVPEDSQGRLSAYRTYYSAIDGAMSLFLLIWFILGCVWVYSVKDVEFQDTYKDEYCHKTLYYFSFWLLNISFMLIAIVAVLSLCLLLSMIVSPKKEAVV